MELKGALFGPEFSKEKGNVVFGMQAIKSGMSGEKLPESVKKKVVSEIGKLIGADKVTDNLAAMASYSLMPLVIPEIVVRPETVEDVQKILRIANENGVPVTPLGTVTASLSSGVTVPNGMVIDTSGMNRILEINADEGYALIEPGVTYGQFVKALKSQGFWYPMGTFNDTISVVSVSTTLTHGRRGSGGWDEICSFEVVLPDGTIVRTGGSMVPEGSWAQQYGCFPDIHGLWLQANGMLGVITKCAVRIYPEGETTSCHLVAFGDYKSAMGYVREVCRFGMVQHSVIFFWPMVVSSDFIYDVVKQGKRDKIGTVPLTQQFFRGGKTPPADTPFCVAATLITGHREVVDASVRVCDRVAKESGGKVVDQDQFREIHAGFMDFCDDYFINKQPSMLLAIHSSFIGPFATTPFIVIGIGSGKNILKLQEYVWDTMVGKEGMGVWPTYSHPFDQGRCFFFRCYPYRLGESAGKQQEDASKYASLNVDILREYGIFSHKPPTNSHEAKGMLELTGGYYEVLKRIKKALDPNNIMVRHVNIL